MPDIALLFDAACEARNNAYAPYSRFRVGAALATADGKVFTGCNVENVAYPEGTCAEAGAVAAMVCSGAGRDIEAVLVVADSDVPVTPCGGCRQKLAEFGRASTQVHLADLTGVRASTTLGEIFPSAFSTEHMDRSRAS